MASRKSIRKRRSTGAGRIRSVSDPATIESQCCAETLFFDRHRWHRLRINVTPIFNTLRQTMHPNDGRVISNFIVGKRAAVLT